MSSPPPSTKRSVLLIEDSLDQGHLIRSFMESHGFEVTLVQDGIRGIALAESRKWDAVVTDLNLQGRDGIELIKRSKVAWPQTPVFAVTAYTDAHHTNEARRVGADDVAVKPLEPEDFVNRLRAMMGEDVNLPADEGFRSFLAVGALPGDAEVGCGGTLAQHRAAGHRIAILSLTSGFGDKADEHRSHAEEAAASLGASLMLGQPLLAQAPTPKELLYLIETAVDRFNPDVLYTHSDQDNRRSRQNAHSAALLAATGKAEVYCFQGASSRKDFSPSLFVDISDHLEEKLKAIEPYQSEVQARPHLDLKLVEATARYWGRFMGFSRVEPYEATPGSDRKSTMGTSQ